MRNFKNQKVDNVKLVEIVNEIDPDNCSELDISINPITDITPLGNLTKLKKLSMGSINIKEIGILAKLELLEELDLNFVSFKDLKPLSNLKKLRVLDLSLTDVVDLEPLSELTQLTHLDLSATRIKKGWSSLEKLKNLTSLELGDINVYDLKYSWIENLVKLTKLNSIKVDDEYQSAIRKILKSERKSDDQKDKVTTDSDNLEFKKFKIS